ncbi:MAG: branched-chain amino acid ABC transporter permease [Chloroflexi bacterium]|nr:MAG: branched-chain amino acid ABC transporter permease [Chloroflexota bacterium]
MKDKLIKVLLKALSWGVLAVVGGVILSIVGGWIAKDPITFTQQVLNGLQLGFVYAMIAVGYTLVYGVLKLINFAYGDVFMVGAFISYFGITKYGFSFLPALLLAAVGCVFLTVIIDRVAYKPLRESPRIAALITALGMSIFLEYFTALKFVFGPDYIAFERPFKLVTWNVGGVTFTNIQLVIFATSVIFFLGVQYIIKRTKMGKAMRASAFDKGTARLMGINVNAVIAATFALTGALAGTAAMLYATAYPQIWTFMGIQPGLKAFVAAVIGGIGSIPGAFVGSLIMGFVEAMTVGYVPLGSTLKDGVAFLLLIAILLIKPTGIFGDPFEETK